MLQKLLQWYKKHTLALAGALVALAALFVLGWVGLQTGRQANGRTRYTIINDDYTHTLELTPGSRLGYTFAPVPGEEIYGLRVNFTTYDRVVRGSLHARLLAGEEELAVTDIAAVTLLDNTFADILFSDEPLALPEGALLTAELSFIPDTAEDRLGVWVSDGGAMALQTICDYSGRWFYRLYIVFAAVLFLAVMAAWWLLYRRKARLTTVFWVTAALLGLAFSLGTPPLVAPDEYAHLAGSYELASKLTGQPTFDENGHLLMRACDAAFMTDKTGEAGILAYRRAARNLFAAGCDPAATTPTTVRVSATGVNLLYLPQTLGILLARLLGLGFFAMVLLGRWCSLAVYILLVRFALAHIPRGKNLLFCCALLPMPLQLAASFSADTLVIGLSFALLALCLDCVERPATQKDIAGLLILCALIGPSKAIYIVLVGLTFIIPAAHLGGCRRALAVKAGCCLAAACGWLSYNSGYFGYIYRDVDYMGVQRFAWKAALALAAALALWFATRNRPKARRALVWVLALGVLAFIPVGYYMLSHMWGGLTPDEIAAGILPNGDSMYTFTIGYICRNIPGTLKILLNTLGTQLPTWLQGILGLSLGEPVVYPVYASWAYGIGLVLVLVAAALRGQDEPCRAEGWRRWWLGLVCLGVFALSLFACLTWTPINYTVLFGVQGRYFLPILPMLLLVLGDALGAVRAQRDLTAPTAFGSAALCALVLLNGVSIYAAL